MFFYSITRGGLITKARWREHIKGNKGIFKPFQNDDRLDVTEMSIEMTSIILMTKVISMIVKIVQGPEAPEFNLGKSL